MDCRSCGVVNAPGRRYCRECGGRLGEPCPACGFLNALADKHCGGCGRRLAAELGALSAGATSGQSYFRALPGDPDFDESGLIAPVASSGASIVGRDVSESEIDGLFENILDEGPREGGE